MFASLHISHPSPVNVEADEVDSLLSGSTTERLASDIKNYLGNGST